MNWKRLTPALAAACSVSALAGAAFADPPGRVGRISDVEGWASFRPADEDFWAPAQRNTPVTSGEGFWSGDDARLELQVAGLEARIDRQTALDVLDLDYGVTRLSLAQGSVDLHIWRAPRGGVRIETAEGEVRIDQPGVYRIDALPAGDDGDYGPVEVTVFEGQAFAPSDGGPVEVDAGQSLTYLPGYDVDVEYAQETAVDQWARARDAREAEIRRRDELWADVTGAADLDEYGDWADRPGFGRVWFPREAGPNWAPYRFGHWSFVRPWGWTWVDDQPWGFAPFHYGRWARFGDRWGWVPGQPEAEPVYAPALVAFIGGGGWGVSVGVSGDAMGWVPLAPGEVFVPAYHVSGDYVRRVNAPHVSPTVINNIVVNNTVVINRTEIVYRNAPAATVVPAAAFARGAAVQKAAVVVPAAALAHAPRAAALEQIAPTREARAGLPAGQGASPGASSGAPAGGPAAFAHAPQPPAKVMTLRAAVAAQPAGATRPQIALKPAAAPQSQGAKPLQPHAGGPGGGANGAQPGDHERQGWSVPRMNPPGPNGPAPNGQGWNGARPNNPGPNGPAPNGQGGNGARPNNPGPNGPAPNGQGWNGARPNNPGPNAPAPNGQGWNGERPNNAGPSGPAPNGQGGNGARPNTPGPSGPAPNGQGWNGERPNTPGPNGPASNGQGWNGERPHTPGPNGPAPNGQGWNGERPHTPGPNGPAPNNAGAPQQPAFRSQTPPPPPPAPPRRDQAQPRPAPQAAPPPAAKPDKKKDDKPKS